MGDPCQQQQDHLASENVAELGLKVNVHLSSVSSFRENVERLQTKETDSHNSPPEAEAPPPNNSPVDAVGGVTERYRRRKNKIIPSLSGIILFFFFFN